MSLLFDIQLFVRDMATLAVPCSLKIGSCPTFNSIRVADSENRETHQHNGVVGRLYLTLVFSSDKNVTPATVWAA